jgi:hypothetical protein
MQQKYIYLLIGIAVGLIAAPQLRKIPGVSKLPTV